ncbi:MAG: hypothetical protein WCJ93_01280 [Methanomicrobiales archaeon]
MANTLHEYGIPGYGVCPSHAGLVFSGLTRTFPQVFLMVGCFARNRGSRETIALCVSQE